MFGKPKSSLSSANLVDSCVFSDMPYEYLVRGDVVVETRRNDEPAIPGLLVRLEPRFKIKQPPLITRVTADCVGRHIRQSTNCLYRADRGPEVELVEREVG